MSQPVIQTSFNSGEWAPNLFARVDLQKYHSGAALIRNFTVDYRGGATTRPGTKFIAGSITPGNGIPPRLIPFQASFTVDYVCEFGSSNLGVNYVGFYVNGAQVISGGVPYRISSPYQLGELSQLKYNQNVDQLILTHPNHPPYILQLISATNWTLTPISFGATIAAPGSLTANTTLSTGSVYYAYVVTAVDINGQESAPSAFIAFGPNQDLRTTPGSNFAGWAAVAGAISYNVYKAEPSYGNPVVAGAAFGFVGNLTGVEFVDSNITPDFTTTPPIPQNPFSGSGVQTVTITAVGTYINVAVPSITFSGGGGSGAAAIATVGVIVATINSGGVFYTVGSILNFNGGCQLLVTGVTAGAVTSVSILSSGSLSSGSTLNVSPTSPNSVTGTGGGGSFNLDWALIAINLTSPGSGYGSAPAVGISGGGGGSATATLGASSSGNPTVSGFIDQRLTFAAPVLSPQQLNLSQPGSYLNFNISNPTQDDDAIQGTLVSGQLNTIEWLIQQPQGLIILADRASWLLNGGSPGAAVGATGAFVARTQSYNGAANVCPPIVANDNILYLQSKGSIVRDLVFNYYTQVFTGSDISILSSHLFYGYNLLEWCWAEEPFKVVWAVRNDGTMLTLTFLKEQELIAWAHSDTQGAFKSVATIVENTAIGNVDAVYTVVQRTINGVNQYYVERFVELYWPQDYISSWQVDAGIGYSGAPATVFAGATHLSGAAVTGVADGQVINFVMPVSGTFQFGAGGTVGLTTIPSASVVTVGLAFVPQLETLPLDLGEPTVQGKRKKISAVTLKVANTLGLEIGSTSATMVPMTDLIVGQQNVPGNYQVTGLVTGEARTIIDPNWTTPGQYFIQQSNPYPASILGVIPEIEIGDSK